MMCLVSDFSHCIDATAEELFKGMSFILTQGTRPRSIGQDHYMETETEESELNTSAATDAADIKAPTFNRANLKKTIEEHGGTVLATFPGSKRPLPKELIILSDRCCETMKFLLAITYGYPRLNFLWVEHSVAQKSKLGMNNYFLPVGYSELKRCEIEQNEVGCLRDLLKGKNVLVTSNSVEFLEDWKQLLGRLGASVCSRAKGRMDKTLPKVDLVVSDREAPKGVVGDAKKKEIPVVSSKWIIQSLINGQRLNYASFLV